MKSLYETYSFYRLGIVRKKGKKSCVVEWQVFSNEEEARKAATKVKASSVLFGSDDNDKEQILFLNVLFSGIDVALILHTYAQTNWIKEKEDRTFESKVDVTEVQDLVSSGELPFVPKNHHTANQWVLKRAMELTFNRTSVKYFACSYRSKSTLYYYDVQKYPGVRGHVALTIDDAPCRFSRANSRVLEVANMLNDYDAKATFMVIGKFIDNGHDEDMIKLLMEGHELANHGMLDRAYHLDKPEDFLQAVDSCNDRIRSLHQKANITEEIRWFRAPHGKYTLSMEEQLRKRNLRNVMCDTYASCPIVQDGEYIGRALANSAKDGSIILLHMPERGFRDWCITALRHLLEGLTKQGLKSVTLSQLDHIANKL